MKCHLIDHGTGWFDIELEMSLDEIKKLSTAATELLNGELTHFHLVGIDESAPKGIMDISFSIADGSDTDDQNMIIP